MELVGRALYDGNAQLLGGQEPIIEDEVRTNDCIENQPLLYTVSSIACSYTYYAKHMIINNGIINNLTVNFYDIKNVTVPNKKKRKRRETVVDDSMKRFKLVKPQDILNHGDAALVQEDESITVILLKTEKIMNPDWTETRICPMCHKTRLIKSFSDTTTKGVARVKTVCNSCSIKWHKHNK